MAVTPYSPPPPPPSEGMDLGRQLSSLPSMDSGELDLLMSMIAEPGGGGGGEPPLPWDPAPPPPPGEARTASRRGDGCGGGGGGGGRAAGAHTRTARRTGKQLSVRPTTHPPRAVELRGKRTAIVGDSPRIASHRARNGPESNSA